MLLADTVSNCQINNCNTYACVCVAAVTAMLPALRISLYVSDRNSSTARTLVG